MAYTPELSQEHSGTLRRIAWALEKPMTKAIEEVFSYLGKALDNKKVCEKCRDKSFCNLCVFNR
jgi:recombinational DNA repair protein RecR